MSDEPKAKKIKSSGEKRKRSTLPDDEIEVDVNLPEPPSKKALRKAKKLKTKPTTDDKPAKEGNKRLARDVKDDDDLLSSDDDEADTAAEKPASKPKAVHSIWIGNLPFSATKAALQQFFREHSQPPIPAESITRVHIPPPANAQASRTRLKPMNKGFAYVDFADQESFTAALALTETEFGGRNVLIKNATSFEGRPEQPKAADSESKTARAASGKEKAASKRVFVGNLDFDVTVEELTQMYAPCGTVSNVHMATFEDSGKSKGFAWVTFDEVEAAQAAVQGWTRVEAKPRDTPDDEEGKEEADGEQAETKKKKQTQKWFVNRLHGRTLRCEFAEDPSTRYKKRFGKEGREQRVDARPDSRRPRGDDTEVQDAPIQEVQRNKYGIAPGATSDASRRRGRNAPDQDKRRSEHRQKMQDESRYRTGALTESTGTKVVF